MPRILIVLVVLFPRIAILLVHSLTSFFSSVLNAVLVPLLGFIFLPLTLLAYTYLPSPGLLIPGGDDSGDHGQRGEA